jgi:hypothetical protein
MCAWLRVMWACWHADRPYYMNHHGAERRLAENLQHRG